MGSSWKRTRPAWLGGSGCASARVKLWKGDPGRWAASRGDPAGATSALLLARNMPSVQYLVCATCTPAVFCTLLEV